MYKSAIATVRKGDQILESLEIRAIVKDSIHKPDGRIVPITTGFVNLTGDPKGDHATMVVLLETGWEVWAS